MPALADRLEREAAELKRRFNQDFWLADRQFFALALDGQKRPVDSLTSNIGHLLWSGIVDDDKAEAVVQHLLSDRLFSGWGMRTMAVGDGGFNPIGYHVGTVWPHDTAFVALGLRRYGYRERSDPAGARHPGSRHVLRRPFAGSVRRLRARAVDFPVEYPTACSPQAWATGAPLMLLRAMLGLEPAGRELAQIRCCRSASAHWSCAGCRGAGAGSTFGPVTARGLGWPGQRARRWRRLLPPAESARQLFATLDQRIDVSVLAGLRAACRFDVTGAGSWRVLVVAGTVHVSESEDPPIP